MWMCKIVKPSLTNIQKNSYKCYFPGKARSFWPQRQVLHHWKCFLLHYIHWLAGTNRAGTEPRDCYWTGSHLLHVQFRKKLSGKDHSMEKNILFLLPPKDRHLYTEGGWAANNQDTNQHLAKRDIKGSPLAQDFLGQLARSIPTSVSDNRALPSLL